LVAEYRLVSGVPLKPEIEPLGITWPIAIVLHVMHLDASQFASSS
jgi:hypothetical protein